ncbi:unnamed protein product [Rotaria socialis]|uniref:MoaB/Mog domain-containing protein n=1 Tax=Rotaria socialis TaxID=392032 RepID=A0A821AZ27_9BILA|nr:unnamed protein product [Rotaria socialis]
MKKGSVFANKKGPLGNGFGTPINSSSTSSSLFDNSLQQQHPLGSGRNWQATPTNTRRLPPPLHHHLHSSNSSTSIRAYTMAPTTILSTNTPNTSRVKPYTMQSLVETLNELLAELAIPHSMRYETKYGFEDILTVLDHLTNPSRYENQRFQPYPPAPQPIKPGGKVSLTDRWAYLKHVLLTYRLSTVEQLTRIKPERSMSTENIMIMIELLIQLTKCIIKSEQEQERILGNNYLREFKLLMRQMFWIGRHDPAVMEESMYELRHHIYAKDNLEIVDKLKHETQMNEMAMERDQLKQQYEILKSNRNELEHESSMLTASNENDLIEFRRKQEEISDEQAKLLELTQIVEQKEMDKKHLTDRNQSLSDRLFSQQTDAELQRHIRSNGELKQQHEVLLSTLLLEQQLHSTATNEHKRFVKELQESLAKYQTLLSTYKHKAPRPPPPTVDFYLSDIIGDTTSIVDNDSVKQAQIAIENLTKEILAQEILLTQRHRDLEQESKKKIEELQSAEREWKSATKNGQRRAAQQNELSRFQQEIRLVRTKILEIERKIEEKKSSTIELKKDFEQIKSGIIELVSRFEFLETNYLNKEEELRGELSWFLFDQTQLAKTFRRDIDDLKRIQQEHMCKLDTNLLASSFNDLMQQQVNKYYHYRHLEDDDDDEDEEPEFINKFNQIHDEHVSWLKKKKKNAKITTSIVERFLSTTCYDDPTKDRSGPALIKYLTDKSNGNIQWIHLASTVVPDKQTHLKETLLKLCDELQPNLILTTGGTGISPDDITPEATREVITKEIPGLAQTMIAKSLAITHMAMLSRPVCGVYQQTLIINLPGSIKGCVECLDFVYPVLRHATDLIQNRRVEVAMIHSTMQPKTNRKHHSCGEHHHHQHVESTMKGERLRQSPFPMISMDDAMKIIFEQAYKMSIIDKPLTECLNYICAEDIYAKEPFPPFRASIKDGYAIRLYSDRSHEQIYEVIGRSDAGGDDINTPLIEGQCVVINTGAKLPDTANAVIQIEDTQVHERHATKQNGLDEKSIRIVSDCSLNQDIRDIGDDVQMGELVLQKNVPLGPAELGLLVTVGLQTIHVYDKPRVVVLSTGNELMPIDAPSTASGKIRDSNKIMLMSALKDLNIQHAIDGGTAKDDETSAIQTLESAFELADIVISTGGVSMGDKDLIKSILTNRFNATIHFGRLQMKPGKPTTFATCEVNGKKKLFFGLPGNPVSALVSYWLLVVPTLKHMMGHIEPHHPIIRVQLNQPIDYLDLRPEYIRVIIEWSTKSSVPIARIVSPDNQCSSRLLSARRCTGLVRLPSKTDADPSFFNTKQDGYGQQVDCLLLSL